ncbi:hypothetical protein EVG20_g8141 [Dentipellis fragilis]|uniref:Uncharacterized protein n=1 Tax=Dentipellis fragilis TaxID=205917 RepID=A0A4Y9Y7Z0_9AGAM|nr:hypothetical protein EVG20_g8141 [Dentipellis fragilis]
MRRIPAMASSSNASAFSHSVCYRPMRAVQPRVISCIHYSSVKPTNSVWCPGCANGPDANGSGTYLYHAVHEHVSWPISHHLPALAVYALTYPHTRHGDPMSTL